VQNLKKLSMRPECGQPVNLLTKKKMTSIKKNKTILKHLQTIKEWYWDKGVQRVGEFKLDHHQWVGRLYAACNNIELLVDGESNRPTSAIWGPSQTGKSTLVAGYIDGRKKDFLHHENALFWENGSRAFFSMPRGMEVPESSADLTVLNPYNGGMDATACITRFTAGTLEKGGSHAETFIPDARFPAELRFSGSSEIMLSLARGYEGQCVRRCSDRYWTLDSLRDLLSRMGATNASEGKNQTADRAVFEEAISLCDVLEDLAFSGLPRYRGLSPKLDNSENLRKIILSAGGLVSNQSLLKKLRDEILWDGEETISFFYEKLIKKSEELKSLCNGKKIYCSLEVASCFLDMDGYAMISGRTDRSLKPGTKEERINRIVNQMKILESGNSLFVGSNLNESNTNTFLKSAEDFGIIQGLIQEVVLGLNLSNIEESPFRSYLEFNDLLDFPGVERGGQSSNAAKIDLRHEEQSDSTGLPWKELFSKVLKRGKTASLFQGYAKKMSIDAVSIFQDLDNDKPNAQDLICGVETLWRTIDPMFLPGQGECPLPLNCVMTWWAKMLNESPLSSSTILGKNQSKYEQLGMIADPEVSNLFAINDFSLPRGNLSRDTQKILSDLVKIIKTENEFLKLFNTDQSSSSFDQMIGSPDGGMDFFFKALISQLSSSKKKNIFLQERAEGACQVLEDLLNSGGLIPNKKSQEKQRVGALKKLGKLVDAKVEGGSTDMAIEAEYALKRMFNFDASDIEAFPSKEDELNPSYLRAQFHRKVLISDEWNHSLSGLGFDSREQFEECWEALCLSIEPSLKEMSDWLRRMVKQRNQFKLMDNRKFLAVKMSNQFIPNASLDAKVLKRNDNETPSTNAFVNGFRNRLKEFIGVTLSPNGRPEQVGDSRILEIKKSCIEDLKMEN